MWRQEHDGAQAVLAAWFALSSMHLCKYREADGVVAEVHPRGGSRRRESLSYRGRSIRLTVLPVFNFLRFSPMQ